MLALTMRMERAVYSNGNSELRDAVGRDWWPFLASALPGVPVLPVPNLGVATEEYLGNFADVKGVIFSGGPDWGQFPERDETEACLFRLAERSGWPVLGVCRGAQVINMLLEGECRKLGQGDHVNTRHAVYTIQNPVLNPGVLPWRLDVNSFHESGIPEGCLSPALSAWGMTEDGGIEGFADQDGRIYGVMWHPERENPAREYDCRLLRHIFGEGLE